MPGAPLGLLAPLPHFAARIGLLSLVDARPSVGERRAALRVGVRPAWTDFVTGTLAGDDETGFPDAAQTSAGAPGSNEKQPHTKVATAKRSLDHQGLRFVTLPGPDLTNAIDRFALGF